MVRTHIMALTYRPKVQAVLDGAIRQTIRLIPREKNGAIGVGKHQVGDRILLHTWSGKPYRSKWGNRLLVKVVHQSIIFYWDGLWHENAPSCEPISSKVMDEIARLDGIQPPTERGLEAVLKMVNGLKDLHDTDWEIITFERVEIEINRRASSSP